jgi:hypothetical protein
VRPGFLLREIGSDGVQAEGVRAKTPRYAKIRQDFIHVFLANLGETFASLRRPSSSTRR